MESKSDFTNFDACLLILTEIVLPSTDVISDLLLIIQLTTYKESEAESKYCSRADEINCFDLNTLGYMMIIPLILSTILLVPHWWKNERSKKHKLLTILLLILQFWPQYRVFRILWLKYIKKNVEWSVEELRIIKGTIGNIGELTLRHVLLYSLLFMSFAEPFVESIPQLHFTLILIASNSDGTIDSESPFFWFSFITSVVSGTFGLSKIIRNGPAKFMSKSRTIKPLIKVKGQFLLLLIILLSIIGKATWLGTAISFYNYNFGTIPEIVFTWMSISLLPHFLFVSTMYLFQS